MGEIYGELNFPFSEEEVNQLTDLKGWAFSSDGLKVGIEVYFDDKLIYETNTGMPRFDVSQKFPENLDAYKSGFFGKLWLSMYENGIHKIRVIAKTKNSEKILADWNVKLKKDRSLRVIANHNNILNQHFDAGENIVKGFIELCDIKPNEKILEIGCQYGRLTVPFTEYLSGEGSFDGLDIIPETIKSCQQEITSKYPNFRFKLSEAYNDWYNPKGTTKASDYKLPYEDNSFDFVFLVSVFTHMLPEDVKNYIKEISRVLKKGGRCLISYFLLNENSINLIDSGKTNDKLIYKFDHFRTVQKNDPESLTAYEEDWIKNLYQENGLTISEPILYGTWCGKESKLVNPQDAILAIKNN